MEKKITDEQLIELLEGNPDENLEQILKEKPEVQKRYYELKEILYANFNN